MTRYQKNKEEVKQFAIDWQADFCNHNYSGSEWIIHDEENTPEGPEEVNGYSCYIVADTEEGIKKELAAVAGCAPSDIVMWAFDEFIRVPQYKAV